MKTKRGGSWESYQKTVLFIDEHSYGAAVWMISITPRLPVTRKARGIAFVASTDFIDRGEELLGLHDPN